MMKSSVSAATMVALVLSLGAVQPAYADNRDAGRVLMGLAGVAVLAHVLNKQKRSERRRATVPARRVEVPRIDYSQCLRQRWTNNGWQTFVANRCVNRLQRQHGIVPRHGRHNNR